MPLLTWEVYPRMYGETKGRKLGNLVTRGLSPHVRGNHSPGRKRNPRRRSIPACTGKPVQCEASKPEAGVYPRMYGETNILCFLIQGNRGLSPHVRGNQEQMNQTPPWDWSIPACTGKPHCQRAGP